MESLTAIQSRNTDTVKLLIIAVATRILFLHEIMQIIWNDSLEKSFLPENTTSYHKQVRSFLIKIVGRKVILRQSSRS